MFRLIGVGSTAFTGRRPKQPVAQRLASGQKPPQFVVFSWDGAGEDSQKLFSHFREVGRKYHANMTYFLSGVYLLPEDEWHFYDPPKYNVGSSDIGFNDTEGIRNTITQVRAAWEGGDEIATHFNGHFCGTDGGVGTRSVDQWKSEIDQAKSFVKSGKTNEPGLKGERPLPFDHDQELIGGRAPEKDVRCVSFRQLADWLDAQDPETLTKLGTLGVGQAPERGLGEVPRRTRGLGGRQGPRPYRQRSHRDRQGCRRDRRTRHRFRWSRPRIRRG